MRIYVASLTFDSGTWVIGAYSTLRKAQQVAEADRHVCLPFRQRWYVEHDCVKSGDTKFIRWDARDVMLKVDVYDLDGGPVVLPSQADRWQRSA